jgi:predicted GNAT family acetyltransferase
MDERLVFRHDERARRFLAELDGLEVAFTEVDRIGTDSLLIKHTEVAPAHEGHGNGSALIRYVLEQARAQGKTVIPICPFTASFIRDHQEYADLVKPSFRAAMPRR